VSVGSKIVENCFAAEHTENTEGQRRKANL
jgi:hypothetical protein